MNKHISCASRFLLDRCINGGSHLAALVCLYQWRSVGRSICGLSAASASFYTFAMFCPSADSRHWCCLALQANKGSTSKHEPLPKPSQHVQKYLTYSGVCNLHYVRTMENASTHTLDQGSNCLHRNLWKYQSYGIGSLFLILASMGLA